MVRTREPAVPAAALRSVLPVREIRPNDVAPRCPPRREPAVLGRVAVVDVGYNDTPSGFAAGIDRVMRALVDAGVDQVVWITLRERRPMLGRYQRPDS